MRFDYGIPTVFIGDYDLALEAYNGDACNSRPVRTIPGFESTVDKESSGEISGVGFSDGRTWHEGRKFMLQNINNFVIKGRSGMALEDLVREEVMVLIDLFKEKVGANGTKLW